MRDRGRLLGIIWSMHCVVGEYWWWNEDKEELEARKPQVEVSRFCLRRWCHGASLVSCRNMRMLDAEMDREAGAALMMSAKYYPLTPRYRLPRVGNALQDTIFTRHSPRRIGGKFKKIPRLKWEM